MITPPLKYFGGKSPMASKLHKLAHPHIHRVHAYAGGLGEFWNWPHFDVSEVVNDVDYWLTNFYRVLQDASAFETFKRQVEVVPFSQVEWSHHDRMSRLLPLCEVGHGCHPHPHPPNIQAAVSFFIQCRQSLSGQKGSFAPLSRTRLRRNMNEQASAWMTAVDGLTLVHNRLRKIAIKCMPALQLIVAEDTPKTLFYLDPTYLPETRTARDVYDFEMSFDDHEDLLKLITGTYDEQLFKKHGLTQGWKPQGLFMLSGYDNELYQRYLVDWCKTEFDRANSAAIGAKKRRMTECVWTNYQIVNGEPVERVAC